MPAAQVHAEDAPSSEKKKQKPLIIVSVICLVLVITIGIVVGLVASSQAPSPPSAPPARPPLAPPRSPPGVPPPKSPPPACNAELYTGAMIAGLAEGRSTFNSIASQNLEPLVGGPSIMEKTCGGVVRQKPDDALDAMVERPEANKKVGRALYEMCQSNDLLDLLTSPIFNSLNQIVGYGFWEAAYLSNAPSPLVDMNTGLDTDISGLDPKVAAANFCYQVLGSDTMKQVLAAQTAHDWSTDTTKEIPIDELLHHIGTTVCGNAVFRAESQFTSLYFNLLAYGVDVLKSAVDAKIQDGTLSC